MRSLSRRTLLAGSAAAPVAVLASPAAHAVPHRLGEPLVAPPAGAETSRRTWVTSWATAQTAPTPADVDASAGFTNKTVRHVLRLSAGGHPRLRFANPFGTDPIWLGPIAAGPGPAASVSPGQVPLPLGTPAPEKAGPGTAASVHRVVLFGGQKQVLLAGGATVVSDPIDLDLPDGADLVISVYLPGPTGPLSLHRNVHATGLLGDGDLTTSADSAYSATTRSVFLLTGVDVVDRGRRTLAVLGDSITEGVGTPDNANQRWPDLFAARFHQRPAVANLGVSGNRLLLNDARFGPGGQARFDRDVLALPGLSSVLVYLGINDLQQPPSQLDPARLLSAYRQLAQRGRDQELKMLGATIAPFKGWIRYTEELDKVRQQVNAGMRQVFDTVVDFDAALRDPGDPARLRPEYDSGDGLHPNAAGASALANALDPRLLS